MRNAARRIFNCGSSPVGINVLSIGGALIDPPPTVDSGYPGGPVGPTLGIPTPPRAFLAQESGIYRPKN
jgi:hypothetical protein